LLAALLALAAARANGQSKPWSQWGQVWASSFNDWSLQIATSVPEPGSYTLRVDAAQGPVILGGPAFQPLATNAPLLLDSGANAEVATPTAVACSWAGGNCSITVTLTRAHAAPFAVRSASAGLQEAIDFVGKGSAAVILDPRWPGTDAMIAAAVGTTAIALEDERAAQRGWYSWNGSGYALALAISGVGQGTTVPQLHSSAPAITPTTIEATVYADLLGASGSAITAQGAAAAGSATLTLATVADFRNGQGIQIVHAGAPYALASPAAPAVNAVGGGGTVCKYAIAAYDGAGGESAIGAAGTVSNSSAVLDGVTAYNSIAWTAVAGARGYAIYGSCGGASPLPLVGLAPIPGYYLPFQQSRAYSVGSLVQPTASAFNGWVYQVTTSGAAAVTEPTWCTSANCTVTSGGASGCAGDHGRCRGRNRPSHPGRRSPGRQPRGRGIARRHRGAAIGAECRQRLCDCSRRQRGNQRTGGHSHWNLPHQCRHRGARVRLDRRSQPADPHSNQSRCGHPGVPGRLRSKRGRAELGRRDGPYRGTKRQCRCHHVFGQRPGQQLLARLRDRAVGNRSQRCAYEHASDANAGADVRGPAVTVPSGRRGERKRLVGRDRGRRAGRPEYRAGICVRRRAPFRSGCDGRNTSAAGPTLVRQLRLVLCGGHALGR